MSFFPNLIDKNKNDFFFVNNIDFRSLKNSFQKP